MTQLAFKSSNPADWLKTDDAKTPAGRTVYIDANIALTNGNGPVGQGEAITIPNLYEAIHNMDERIEKIADTHGPSTADAGLFVTYNSSEVIAGSDTQQVITLSPSEFTDTARANATEGKAAGGTDTHVFRISAPNIEFEVTNQNATAVGYFVKFIAQTGDAISTQLNALKTIDTVNGINIVTGEGQTAAVTDDTFVLIPVEGYTISNDISENNAVEENIHCRLFKQDSSVYKLAVPHMVVTTDMSLEHVKYNDKLKDNITVPSVMRYRLGAIIEAIQELNRRTMFMDTNMSFQGAMSYNDYNADNVTDAQHTKFLDSLPAASDSNLSQHKAQSV